ncbi:hypothetical protein BH24ACT19_BH24ACT19_18090 [soil metagenome]
MPLDPPQAAAVVVDTDVVSYLFKRDSRAEAYRPHLTGRLLVVSFMTVTELDRWALERGWGESRCARMEQHMSNFVVRPFDRSLCRRWAEATDGARRRDRPIGVADAWIAATALRHDVPLVTNNDAHYSGVEGLTVVSEPV